MGVGGGDRWFPVAGLPAGVAELLRDTNKRWVCSVDHRATYVHMCVRTTHTRNQEFMCLCPGEIHEYLKKEFGLSPSTPSPPPDDLDKGRESRFMFSWTGLAVHTRP